MTVAPLIAMKSTKCESLEAVGKELDRRAHTYANDVDQSGRHVGYLCRAGDESPVPLEQAIERRMGELNTKRKIRDNQVRAMGFIVSSNDALDEKDAREFLDRSVQWFGARRRCSLTVPGRRSARWASCRGRWTSGLCWMRSVI